ncbi:cytochrome c nitrite reductase small subunit [bacterium]|nr:cytochrome c nitrite reductase small subunit [bacterium]MCI0612295.1 cytochrome c nitrite reductase small subunit [bacterium]
MAEKSKTRRAIIGLVLGIAIGSAVGICGYTFLYAKGTSYITDNPAACANCHVMTEQFDGWRKSSHRSVAVCNDCHTPPGLIPKYVTKARNGFWHSFYFTTGGFHEPIQILPRDLEITEKACRKCHQEIVEAIEGHSASQQLSCVRCHNSVGHLE